MLLAAYVVAPMTGLGLRQRADRTGYVPDRRRPPPSLSYSDSMRIERFNCKAGLDLICGDCQIALAVV